MIPSGAEGKQGFGFRFELQVCPTCSGRGLVDSKPNLLLKSDAAGPFLCRQCRGSGATHKIKDPNWETKR